MDADRFDALSRSLSATPSRRRALRLLAGSALGSFFTIGAGEADAHDALNKCKKKSGKQKRKCLKKARVHNATHTAVPGSQVPPCTPNCAGKDCGDNLCGGSCGTCTGGSDCANGACVCPNGTERCGGTCESLCTSGMARHPTTCGCCSRGAFPCNPVDPDPSVCCAGCEATSATTGYCRTLRPGDFCQFDAQCQTNICTNGICQCPSGHTRVPFSFHCCLNNGENCPSSSSCCSGLCDSGRCQGKPDGQPCDFDEQCDDTSFGCVDNQCGPVNEL